MSLCAICIDTGTTNTRVWLIEDGVIMARSGAMVGVRDTARDGHAGKLWTTLRELIGELQAQRPANKPACVIAAGMITSALGLKEVPHLRAPADAAALAAAVERCAFPDLTDLPVLLVPGVRCGDGQALTDVDLMRGEETLCAGLLALGLAPAPSTVLNLGSHWKAIKLDDVGRIAASVTSLAGEMILAVQTNTILASAVPHGRAEVIDLDWCRKGMAEQRRSGLARALFTVRLLEQAKQTTPEERLAYLIGAFIASDLDALKCRGALIGPVVIVGGSALASAWRECLSEEGIEARALNEAEIEGALLAGLTEILRRML